MAYGAVRAAFPQQWLWLGSCVENLLTKQQSVHRKSVAGPTAPTFYAQSGLPGSMWKGPSSSPMLHTAAEAWHSAQAAPSVQSQPCARQALNSCVSRFPGGLRNYSRQVSAPLSACECGAACLPPRHSRGTSHSPGYVSPGSQAWRCVPYGPSSVVQFIGMPSAMSKGHRRSANPWETEPPRVSSTRELRACEYVCV